MTGRYPIFPIPAVVVLAACSFSPQATSPDAVFAPAVSIAFVTSSSGADELAGSLPISVVLSAPSEETITVAFAVTGGSAQLDQDFTIDGGTLTFAPGTTEATFAVTMLEDDDGEEPAETIELTLRDPVGASLGALITHTIEISDHLLPRVAFQKSEDESSEGKPAILVLELDRPAETDSTVVLGVSGGTGGSDYTIIDGSILAIAAGATEVEIDIGVLDDALDEDAEPVTFTLSSPSRGLLLGTVSQYIHTIVDNDDLVRVRFTNEASAVKEASGVAVVEVALSEPSGKTIIVGYKATGSGSASIPEDADIVGISLIFAPLETTKTIVVNLVDDGADEGDEDLELELENPVNANLGMTKQHTLTISDGAAPPD